MHNGHRNDKAINALTLILHVTATFVILFNKLLMKTHFRCKGK